MQELLLQLATVVERGKVNKNAPFPPDLKGQDGADEITAQLLEGGVKPDEILTGALMVGMKSVGDRFGSGEAFIPDLLIAAKAMYASMAHLKPFFESGDVDFKGTVILGTVSGDLHDIGKNLVKMILVGDGWKVIDLGTDIGSDKFLQALKENPGSVIGMSALLTTTMMNMEPITKDIKANYPDTKVFVGGAPLSDDFAQKIKADGYFSQPQDFAQYLSSQK